MASSNPSPAGDTDHPEMQTALKSLLQMAGMTVDSSQPIEAQDVQFAVDKIRSLLVALKNGANKNDASGDPSNETVSENRSAKDRSSPSTSPHVLIAGQLGIILHQLKQNLRRLGAETTIAKDMEDAIAEYQKRDYRLVIIDLFMPTEREGMIVLDEIRKLSVICNISSDIIILAPPSKDKSLQDQCRAQGASLFLEKMDGWHNMILHYYQTGEVPVVASK